MPHVTSTALTNGTIGSIYINFSPEGLGGTGTFEFSTTDSAKLTSVNMGFTDGHFYGIPTIAKSANDNFNINVTLTDTGSVGVDQLGYTDTANLPLIIDPGDITAPTAPILTAVAPSAGQVNLSWSGSTDNVVVTAYKVYRGTTSVTCVANLNSSCVASAATAPVVIATVTNGTTYNDTSVQPNISYIYYVVAKDAVGNQSLYSNGILVAIGATGTVPVINPTPAPTTPAPAVNNSDDKKKKEELPKRVIHDSIRNVPRGSVMIQSGKRFSKNSTVTLFYTTKTGAYAKPLIIKTNKSGAFSTSFKVTKPIGTYKWYVVDGKSGRKSNVKIYNVI
jgi:hypothetical protein